MSEVYQVGDWVRVILGSGHAVGEVVEVADVTVQVRLSSGAVVKRHVQKHIFGRVKK